jgi:hypothetical protein
MGAARSSASSETSKTRSTRVLQNLKCGSEEPPKPAPNPLKPGGMFMVLTDTDNVRIAETDEELASRK